MAECILAGLMDVFLKKQKSSVKVSLPVTLVVGFEYFVNIMALGVRTGIGVGLLDSDQVAVGTTAATLWLPLNLLRLSG